MNNNKSDHNHSALLSYLTLNNVAVKTIHNGRYAVTSDGEIYSFRGYRWIEPSSMPHGYKYVCLKDEYGRKYRISVHRLVAQTFLGDIPVGMVVHHVDHVKTNNDLSNLAIVTPSENSRAAHKYHKGKLSDHFVPLPIWDRLPGDFK